MTTPETGISKVDRKTILPEKDQCVYTSCYCEENVWKLCQHLRDTHSEELLDDYFVVFISNPSQETILWKQKAGQSQDDFLVVWDYHVILIDKQSQLVFDLDTSLPFPCSFDLYMQSAIRSDFLLNEKYHRWFRVIPSKEYLATFASDRSRMRTPDGRWIKPPPSYPCIQTEFSTNNLDDFINMIESRNSIFKVGQIVVGTEELEKLLQKQS